MSDDGWDLREEGSLCEEHGATLAMGECPTCVCEDRIARLRAGADPQAVLAEVPRYRQIADELTVRAIRGFFFAKHLPGDTADEWTDEVMAIVREYRR